MLGGCPMVPAAPEVSREGTSRDASEMVSGDASRADATSADTAAPDAHVPVVVQAPIETSVPVSPPQTESGFPWSDPALLPDYLSLFVDGLLLDELQPSVPSSGFTYLELLCRDTGIPEHRCRQLYGGG